MTPPVDGGALGDFELPSYGIRRIQAAVMADPELQDAAVTMIDRESADVAAYTDAILATNPNLIGISIYVWSTPTLVEVARQIKQARPQCTIIFGGPSARTVLFDLPLYQHPESYMDGLVSSEGEMVFREIAKCVLSDNRTLESIPGLHIPTSNGWIQTDPRPSLLMLDEIPSPYASQIMKPDAVSYLETFRGCPLSCTFCEWGASDKNGAVFSAEYLTRELEAYQEQNVPAVFLVDAGLNLNARGFQNLCEAERNVSFLKSANFWCEIYPSHVRQEHLDFLSNIGPSYLGIGLQSLDPEVLQAHQRPFNQTKFESSIEQLASVSEGEVQIIFGLPLDSPEGFLKTLSYARSLPVGVRAYHCLVLPDALMSRSQPEWEIAYDPLTLEMTSCRGWSHDDLLQMRDRLTSEAIGSGGRAGNYWWYFPRI